MKKKVYFRNFVMATFCTMLPMSSLFAESPFAGGDGTDADPYLIETPQQFNEIRNYLDKAFKLTSDLDFKDFTGWAPIGSFGGIRFSGKLDGNKHVIKNLTAEGDGEMGLFGTTEGGLISQLIIQDCVFKGGTHVGALAGCLYKIAVDQVAVINVEVVGKSGNFHGGLAGQVHDFVSLTNSYVTGHVSGMAGTGGISGYMEHGSLVKNCYISAIITGAERASAGIVGGVVPDCSIEGCVVISPEINVASPVEGRDASIRIVEEVQGGTPFSNNYVYAETVCAGKTYPDETDANSQLGASVSMEQLTSAEFYTEGPGFYISESNPDIPFYLQIWKIDSNISPYPVFVWQKSSDNNINDAVVEESEYNVLPSADGITISGLKGGENISVYSITGVNAGTAVALGDQAFISLKAKGIYVVSVNGVVKKVVK